ncbi:MAG: class I SAM-dependent methyltransferase [Candidatus Bathyarchaeia archaeon]|nr:class I SAM-dependent methyltransferase [Candidatus Bathyarchaeia archaeon]
MTCYEWINLHSLEEKCRYPKDSTKHLLILDVGSGRTYSSPILTKNNSEIIHLDVLKKRQHQEVQATVYQLPFPKDTFDVVYLSHVLEHLDFPLNALEEIKRVKKICDC